MVSRDALKQPADNLVLKVFTLTFIIKGTEQVIKAQSNEHTLSLLDESCGKLTRNLGEWLPY